MAEGVFREIEGTHGSVSMTPVAWMVSGDAAETMSVIGEDSVKLLQRLFVSYENRDKKRSSALPSDSF